jgi:hypothetical protein
MNHVASGVYAWSCTGIFGAHVCLRVLGTTCTPRVFEVYSQPIVVIYTQLMRITLPPAVVSVTHDTFQQNQLLGFAMLILDTNQFCATSLQDQDGNFTPPVRTEIYDAMICGDSERILSVVRAEEDRGYTVKTY